MAKELDLLFGVICSDCGKLITVYVHGTPKDATARVIHGGKVCEPAPLRTPIVTTPNVSVEREIEVWTEGYAATGERGPASLLGVARACTFREACDKVAKTLSDPGLYDSEKLTYWGCRLFDNEAGARRSFG